MHFVNHAGLGGRGRVGSHLFYTHAYPAPYVHACALIHLRFPYYAFTLLYLKNSALIISRALHTLSLSLQASNCFLRAQGAVASNMDATLTIPSFRVTRKVLPLLLLLLYYSQC